MQLITPARLVLALAVVGSGAVAVLGLLNRSLPMTVSGLGVLGVALFGVGIVAAGATVRAGRRGAGGTAFGAALLGGLSMLAASGCLTLAILLGLLAAPS